MLPVIAITPGEPAGIGPDIAILTAHSKFKCNRVYFCDPDLLCERAQALNLDVNIHTLSSLQKIPQPETNTMFVWPVKLSEKAQSGILNINNSPYVLECIRVAVKSQQNNQTHALVTGPIHKGIINKAGISFSGHTEYLAELTSGTPVMMLASEAEKLRVALATTHLPLSQVCAAINKDMLHKTITILHNDLQQKYGIKNPHILVCGLNPHAGEDGHMGMEEINIISPVLKKLTRKGYNLSGPLPADTVFTPKYLQAADVVLAMYHDQGLPVLKHVGFGHAINITLGLPIIRTSVDHGTALNLAASSQVNTGSYIAALNTAIHLANNQNIEMVY